MRRRVQRLLAVLVVVTTAWMCWDNVFSDLPPIQQLAEQAACNVKPCSEQHGVTHVGRNPLGQSFDISWREVTLHVSCQREYYVAGPRACIAAP
jgi:hypothetical protein